MKRLFIMCALVSGLSFSLEKAHRVLEAENEKNLKLTATLLPSTTIHQMMEKREIAPSIAWVILLGNFPQDYRSFLNSK